MESRVDKVMSMLRVEESHTVRVVGISGIGGRGKTTLASVIFHKLSNFYDASCFLQIDTGKGLLDDEYLKSLQKSLLPKILKLKTIDINNILHGTSMIKQRFQLKKVLIVLDNIDNWQQLDALAAHDKTSFAPGSRIIVTTRNQKLLMKHIDESCQVEELRGDESMELFSHIVFQQNHPPPDLVELVGRVLQYAERLPLAVRVLGSRLKGLSPDEWLSEAIKLKKSSEILSVLRKSYDGLDDTDKSLFLDVACFFRGMEVEIVKHIVNWEIAPLVQTYLVSVQNGRLQMLDFVQEMGWKITRESYPGIRLLDQAKIIDVLNGNGEYDDVEGLKLNIDEGVIDLNNSDEGLKRMKKLKVLILSGRINCTGIPHQYVYNDLEEPRSLEEVVDNTIVVSTGLFLFAGICLSSAPQYLSSELRWIHWDEYPWSSLPENFDGRNLVGLVMRRSRIDKLIRSHQRLDRLRILRLCGSDRIERTPNFSKLPCLEELYMTACVSLEEVHSSFGLHTKLRIVDLSDCNNLKDLPKSLRMESLKLLDLHGCAELENFPEIEKNTMVALEKLNLWGTGICKLPDSFSNLHGLLDLLLPWGFVECST